MRKLLTLFLCLLLTTSTLHAEDLTIGWIGALTGDAAGIGVDSLAALKTAVAEINTAGGIAGRTLRIEAEDDRYEVARTLTAYEKLKARINSRVIFVSTYGALFALGKRPEQQNILLLDTLDCNDAIVKVSSHHLCLASRTESIAENFVRAIHANGGGKVAVLYEEEAWFNFVVQGLKSALGSELTQVTAPVGAGDYQAELLRVKKSQARHLILLGNESMGRAARQAEQIKLGTTLYSLASAMSPGFQALSGNSMEGALISHWEAPRGELFERFRGSFTRVNGRAIALEFIAAPTYDAAYVIAKALSEVIKESPGFDAKKLRASLLAASSFQGVSGAIKFEPDGAVRSINERLYRIEKGELVPVP